MRTFCRTHLGSSPAAGAGSFCCRPISGRLRNPDAEVSRAPRHRRQSHRCRSRFVLAGRQRSCPRRSCRRCRSCSKSPPRGTSSGPSPSTSWCGRKRMSLRNFGTMKTSRGTSSKARVLQKALWQRLTLPQFVGLVKTIGVALARNAVRPDQDLHKIVEQGKKRLEALRGQTRRFNQLKPDERHVVLTTAVWITRIDRARRLLEGSAGKPGPGPRSLRSTQDHLSVRIHGQPVRFDCRPDRGAGHVVRGDAANGAGRARSTGRKATRSAAATRRTNDRRANRRGTRYCALFMSGRSRRASRK